MFSHKNVPKARQPMILQITFILILMLFSTYLVVIALITICTDDAYRVLSTIRNVFGRRLIEDSSFVFNDINNKWQILQFYCNVLIPQIYDPIYKTDWESEKGCHYVTDYNHFMGMRLTLNIADLESDFKYFNTS